MLKKVLLVLFLFLILFIAFLYWLGMSVEKTENIKETVKEVVSEVLPKREVTMHFVGDIMLDRSIRSKVENKFGGGYGKLFANLDELKTGDILFGNLEGPMSDQGYNVGSIYSFRMDPKALPALVSAGFDVLSVANNHSGDWTISAFTDTVSRLREVGIGAVGGGMNRTEAESPVVINKNGLKIGFLGFSDVGPNWLESAGDIPGILIVDDDFENIISRASVDVDVLVVSIHFGNEYEKLPSERQKDVARRAIDAGALVAAGHHTHVVQPIEEYKNGVIAYGLGNFIFDQNFSVDTMRGIIFDVTVSDHKVVSHDFRLTRQDADFVPHIIK